MSYISEIMESVINETGFKRNERILKSKIKNSADGEQIATALTKYLRSSRESDTRSQRTGQPQVKRDRSLTMKAFDASMR